jgi:hypothetical protein
VVNFPKEGETLTVRGGVEMVSQAVARINQIVQDLVCQQRILPYLSYLSFRRMK